jgi:hypothetical protein
MIDIYRVFHPTIKQYTFFSAGHGTFSKIDHILGHKAGLNKFKKIEINLCIISDHNGTKLNNKRNPRKYSNTWRLIKEEIKKFLESSENENIIYQNLGHSKGCTKGKIYSYKCLH